jgi:LPS export ABC transporter protein LptC
VRSTLAKSDFVLADPEGRWRWEASAASAEMDEAAGTSRLSRVKGTYFLKDRAALRLRADRGRLDRKQEKALLEGKVQGESLLTGAKLRADRVEIDLKAMRLEARGKVRIELGAAVLSGESFSADIGLKKIWAGGEESPRPGGGKK